MSGGYSASPALIEPGVKYFFGGVLKQCNRLREEYNNTVFNLCMLGLFLAIVGALLYYKRASKPTCASPASARASLGSFVRAFS